MAAGTQTDKGLTLPLEEGEKVHMSLGSQNDRFHWHSRLNALTYVYSEMMVVNKYKGFAGALTVQTNLWKFKSQIKKDLSARVFEKSRIAA